MPAGRQRRGRVLCCALLGIGITQSGYIQVSAERADPAEKIGGAVVSVTIPVPAPPAPEPTPPPTTAPAPDPPPSPPPVAESVAQPAPPGPLDRVEEAFEAGVPAMWRARIPVTFELVPGTTSYVTTNLTMHVGRYHATGSWSHLVTVVAHEFGHLIAITRGSGAYLGAPPAGFPDPGYGPTAEEWADCVGYAFTGIADPAYGMPVCSGATLDWTANWLSAN